MHFDPCALTHGIDPREFLFYRQKDYQEVKRNDNGETFFLLIRPLRVVSRSKNFAFSMEYPFVIKGKKSKKYQVPICFILTVINLEIIKEKYTLTLSFCANLYPVREGILRDVPPTLHLCFHPWVHWSSLTGGGDWGVSTASCWD